MCCREVKKKKETKVETFAIFLSGFFSIVILANSQAPTFKRSGGFIFHDPIGKNGGPQSPPFKRSGGFIVDDPIVDNSPRGAVSPKFKQSGKNSSSYEAAIVSVVFYLYSFHDIIYIN